MTRLRMLAGLIVLVAVGTFPALAQTPHNTYIFRPGQSQIVATATTTNMKQGVNELSGSVAITIDGVRILADEGDVDLGKGEIRLRGDVRIKIR